jgi:glycine betaine/proline transport system substrate-binding protein
MNIKLKTMEETMLRHFKYAFLAAAAATVMIMPAEAKTKVTIGELDWSGSRAIEQVLNQIMASELDADVGTIAAAQEALYEALDKGDGSVDVVADMWTDHLPAQMQKYVVPGSRETIILNTNGYLGTEGIFVPAYVAEAGVTKLEDLAKPDVAKMFDSDGNGKGELWAGAVGWESTNHTQVRGKSYGFDKSMEYTTVEQAVFLAQLKDAYDKKQPIAFYYWTPEWIHAAYKLHKLEEPEFNGYAAESAKGTERYSPDGCYTFYQPAERNDWLEASTIKCGQPPTRVHIAHSKELAQRDPKISQFLKQVKLDADTVNQWILAMDVDGKKVEDVARDWIAANREMIDKEWLAGLK